MKKILGIVVLLVVVVLGGYFSTGLVTEHTLKKNLKALNQANGFSAELAGYHRGLFRSTADLTWRMQMPEKILKKEDGASLVVPPKVYSFDMPLVIHHGPVIVKDGRVRFGLGAARGELSLPDAYASEFTDMFSAKSTKPTLAISLFVTYLNKTHLELDLPAFQLFTKHEHNEFEWLGMNTDLRFSPESTHLQGRFTLEGLRLIKQKIRVILNKVTTGYDVHKAKNGLFLGEANLHLPILQVTDKNQTEFELKQFELNTKSDIQDDFFSSSFRAAFTSLLSRDKKYGPGELDVSIKKLDASVLAGLNERLSQLQQTTTKGAQTQQLLLSILPDLPKLLGKGAVFEVSTLKLGVEKGAIDGSARIVFPESESDSPMQVLPKIEGEGHLSVPAPFLKDLLVHSFKRQLLRTHEMASTGTQDKKLPNEKAVSPSTLDAESTVADNKDPAKPVTIAEIDQQAVHHADQKLADLIRLGALQAKGADYVLELKLSSGHLLVNGHPFHSGMLSF